VSRKLIVNDGRRERELLIVSKIVVGRDPTCDLSEADSLLSRRHAEFAIAGENIVVRDLGSRNGIYVNGTRTAETVLQSGDTIRIGPLMMRFIEDSSPLVALPELVDDATGIVFPGSRAAASPGSVVRPMPGSTPRSEPVAPRPAPTPDAAAPRSVSPPRPPAPPASRAPHAPPRPSALSMMPALPEDHDPDVTSYMPASAVLKSLGSDVKPGPSPSQVQSPPSQADASQEPSDQTRVVAPPSRSGLRPPSPPVDRTAFVPPPRPVDRTAFVPPPAPDDGDDRTTFKRPPVEPRRASMPAPPDSSLGFTAVMPPPAPPAKDLDEPTAFVSPRRSGVQAQPTSDHTPDARAGETRALTTSIRAIAEFLRTSPAGRPAADAVAALERDLAGGTLSPDLVNALKTLVERLSAAASELI